MTKKSFNLRNAVKSAVAVLAVALMSSGAMAQEVQYTDASGVTCTYATFVESGTTTYVRLKTLDNFPPTVSKWVLPENVTVNGIAYPLRYIADNAWVGNQLQSTALTEVVFPKFLDEVLPPFSQALENQRVFPNVRKITFGEQARWFHNAFDYLPLDSIIFLGTNTFVEDKLMGTAEFKYSPATTKIIVPCGTLTEFVTRFANSQWNNGNGMSANFWTSANFYEAECLNTLTVLSSDNALGNAYSFAGCGFVTQTPNNTSATYSGNITLLALPQANKVFTGWNDGNLDNPRVVNVTADVTYTANFATCNGAGIEGVQAAAPLKVFPNPTNNTLNVELEKSTNGTLSLFDLGGKIVANQSINGTNAQINLSALSAGTYILRLVENEQASASVKVVKE